MVKAASWRGWSTRTRCAGVTSNPSIFEKAILGSEATTTRSSRRWRSEGLDAAGDLRAHRDRATCRPPAMSAATSGTPASPDGFVSLEVAPDLAHDDRAHARQARAITGSAVDRPNVMIKIPGTPEGVRRDRAGDLRGHQRQRDAAVRGRAPTSASPRPTSAGLERRLAERQVARRRLGRQLLRLPRRHRGRQAPRGAAATRSSAGTGRARQRPRWPTAASRRHLSEPRWAALHHAGARPQRPLWASTGVKNPRYPDTKYVDELVGPHTVNTMPLADARGGRRARPRQRPDGPPRSIGRPQGAGRRRDRLRRGHRRAVGRRRQAVRRRHEPAAGRDRGAPPVGAERASPKREPPMTPRKATL